MSELKRKSLRLPFYDYSQEGYYFVTVCSHNKENIFGKIKDGIMLNNSSVDIIEDEWLRTTILRENIKLGSFIVMPNHIHGIIIINFKMQSRGVLQYAPTQTNIRSFTSTSNSLGAIIRGFKAATTKRINILNGTPHKKIWQRNYYEHIIRNQKDYIKIDEYIRRNVELWGQDKFYV